MDGSSSPEQRATQAPEQQRRPDSVRTERGGRLRAIRERFLTGRKLAAAGVAAVIGLGVGLPLAEGGSSSPGTHDTGKQAGIEHRVDRPRTLAEELKNLGLNVNTNRLITGDSQRKVVSDNTASILASSPFTGVALPDGNPMQDLIQSKLADAGTISAVNDIGNEGYTIETDVNPGSPSVAEQSQSPITVITSYDSYAANQAGNPNAGVYSTVSINLNGSGRLSYAIPENNVFTMEQAEALGKKLAPSLPTQPINPDLGEVNFGLPDASGNYPLTVDRDGQVIWNHTGGSIPDINTLLNTGDANNQKDLALVFAILQSQNNVKPAGLANLPPELSNVLAPYVKYRNADSGNMPTGVPEPSPAWALDNPAFREAYTAMTASLK